MVKVETSGLFHYEVAGDLEKEAAAELEEKLDFLSRSYHLSGANYLTELSSILEAVEKKFSVIIHTAI